MSSLLLTTVLAPINAYAAEDTHKELTEIAETTVTLPPQPTEVIADIHGNRSLYISWTKPEDATNVEHYEVEWRTTSPGYNDFYDSELRRISTTTTDAIITDLLHLKDTHLESLYYQVRVRSVNKTGRSEWSGSNLISLQSTPTAPTGVKLIQSGNKTFVEWDPPAQDGGSPITGYEIHYQRARHSHWGARRTRHVDATETSYLTEGGPTDVSWRFRIAAKNIHGRGSWSSVKKIKLYTRPKPPTHLSVIPGDAQLTVEWAIPSEGTAPNRSHLRWRPVNGGTDWFEHTTLNNYVTSHTINDLQNGTSYEIEISTAKWHIPSSGSLAVVAAPSIVSPAAPVVTFDPNRYNRLDVKWSWPSGEQPVVDEYQVRWRYTTEEFNAEQTTTVEQSKNSVTFYEVASGRSYIVEVTPILEDEHLPSGTTAAYTNSPSDIVRKLFREVYEPHASWVGEAIDARWFGVRKIKGVGHWVFYTGRKGQWRVPVTVRLGLHTSVLNNALHRKGQAVQTVLHELGHVFTYDWKAAQTPGPIGILWFYIDTVLEGRCNGGEILADTLIYPVQQDAGISYNSAYFRSCKPLGNKPNAEATAIAREASRGYIPSWFIDNYSKPNGSIDMVQFWYDLRNPSFDAHKSGAKGYLFRNLFGGYCSEAEAWHAFRSDRDAKTHTDNPWADGGCLSHAPSLVQATQENTTITVTWEAPLWAKEPNVDAYLVQWKLASGDSAYTNSRQIIIDGLDTTTATLTELIPGQDYMIRVAAIVKTNPGVLISFKGHARFVEVFSQRNPDSFLPLLTDEESPYGSVE